jgi:hypothetical protein
MAEKLVRKSKGPPSKSMGKKKAYRPSEENEEEALEPADDYQTEKPIHEVSSKNGSSSGYEEPRLEHPLPQKTAKISQKLQMPSKIAVLPTAFAEEQRLSDATANPYHSSWASLPPIATTHNLHSTLENPTHPTSIKAFGVSERGDD